MVQILSRECIRLDLHENDSLGAPRLGQVQLRRDWKLGRQSSRLSPLE